MFYHTSHTGLEWHEASQNISWKCVSSLHTPSKVHKNRARILNYVLHCVLGLKKMSVYLKENLLAENVFLWTIITLRFPQTEICGFGLGLWSWFPPDDEHVRRIRPARHFTKASWAKLIVEIIGGNGSMIYLGLLLGNTAQFLKGQKGFSLSVGSRSSVCVCVCVRGLAVLSYLVLCCLSVECTAAGLLRAQSPNLQPWTREKPNTHTQSLSCLNEGIYHRLTQTLTLLVFF